MKKFLLNTLVYLGILIALPLSAQVTEEWAVHYIGPGNDDDQARAMVADASGNVYVTGHSNSTGSGYDYITIKYDARGRAVDKTLQWSR